MILEVGLSIIGGLTAGGVLGARLVFGIAHAKGYNEGLDRGHAMGQVAGRAVGHREGYDLGHADGLAKGIKDLHDRFPYPLNMDEAERDGLTKCLACAGAGWYRKIAGMD